MNVFIIYRQRRTQPFTVSQQVIKSEKCFKRRKERRPGPSSLGEHCVFMMTLENQAFLKRTWESEGFAPRFSAPVKDLRLQMWNIESCFRLLKTSRLHLLLPPVFFWSSVDPLSAVITRFPLIPSERFNYGVKMSHLFFPLKYLACQNVCLYVCMCVCVYACACVL